MKVMLLVGTKKGLFVLESDRDRRKWAVDGPYIKGWEVNCTVYDDRKKPVVLAGVNSFVYGAHIQRSEDLGRTWSPVDRSPKFGRAPVIPSHPDSEVTPDEAAVRPKLKEIWTLARGLEPGVIWAGVADAALFRSDDSGMTWSVVEGLYDHPTRAEWIPGNGGMCLHSISQHPDRPSEIYVGMSTVGTLRTDDGGKTWGIKNDGVEAWWPGWTRCVHKLIQNQRNPDVLYQQNHTGVYRSKNRGESWERIESGLPSFFGFPILAHPGHAETLYVVPEESDEYRIPVDGKLRVYRSLDGGDAWSPAGVGLPEGYFAGVLRNALQTDGLDPAGIYIGTSAGQLFYSRDDGDTWTSIPAVLPRITSVDVIAAD